MGAAYADDYGAKLYSAWDVNVGAGALVRPTFSGSDRYTSAPLPLVDIKWHDMISLGYNGLDLYWHRDAFQIGAGLAIDPGRDTRHANTVSMMPTDERLSGMGKIDISPGLKVFASYQLGAINLAVSAVKYQGNQNKGLTAHFGVSAPLRLGAGFTLTPHAAATWADRKYTQTYYGVTALQSFRSTFPVFYAKAGMQDVNGGLTLTYAFNRHWYTSFDATATQILGDAKKSPISFSNLSVTGMTSVGYHF